MSFDEYCKRLKESLGVENVKVTTPPTYVSNLRLINQHEPIILIFKEAKQINHLNYVGLNGQSDIIDSIADLSITGQPLECPFKNDNADYLDTTVSINPAPVSEDYYHAPLSMIEARRCSSFVDLNTTPLLPVWILTDMSDRNKTFLLGSERELNWRTRKWAMVHSNQTEKLPITDLLKNFEKLFKVTSGYKIISEVSSTFIIEEEQGIAKNSKCFLEAKWKTPSYEVPLSQADTNLIIECNVGQEESQISRWWGQLILLHNYLEIIKEQKETQQVQLTYQRDSIKLPSYKTDNGEVSPLRTRVLELLQSSDSMSVCRQLASQHNVTSALNSTIHELLTDKQKGQDFTDRLWSLLIEAETYQELAECFQLVIREVRKQSVKPYIFSKNRTRLASLLRGLRASSSDIELMLEPLELMIEMGLEKLKRDYMFMFLASQIASEESLSLPKLPSFSEGGEWQLTVDSMLRWLAQLHTVLELVSVIHMTMDSAIVVQVTGLALATYVSPQSPVQSLQHLINNRTYNLCAPVLTKEVKTFIKEENKFCKWMLKLSAEANNQRLSSTYVLLEESPLPEKLLVLLEDDDTLNNTDILTETVHEKSSMNLSKLYEKYTYIQMCSISENLP